MNSDEVEQRPGIADDNRGIADLNFCDFPEKAFEEYARPADKPCLTAPRLWIANSCIVGRTETNVGWQQGE